MTTQTFRTGRLDVPGAQLHHEVRGSGPLLLVVGQPMTSAPFAPLADLLADRFTVVTYDPRGLGASTVDDRSLDVTPEVEGDDLARLVEALGGGPADLFGSSGGAVAGLAWAARHPEQVGTLVAHEPPVAELLPDAPQIRSVVDGIRGAYDEHGSGAAWGRFVSLVVHDGPVPADGVPPVSWPPPGQGGDEAAPSAERLADDETFFRRMLVPFTRYRPDVAALRSGPGRVVVAVGAASRGEVARRSAEVLAGQLGTLAVAFPGDHGGFMADPAAFAAALREQLDRTS